MTLRYAENGPMKGPYIYIKSLEPLNVRAKTCTKMIKLRVLRWGDYSGISGWPLNVITNVLVKREAEGHRRGEGSVATKEEIAVIEP